MTAEIKIPDRDDDRVLRHVEIQSGYVKGPTYRLLLWDTHRTEANRPFSPRAVLGYAFGRVGEAPIFVGEDYQPAPSLAIDSDESIRELLGFLTLRPGDTDSEHFESYTPAQLEFAEGDAEDLSIYAIEPERGEERPPVGVDVDFCHGCGAHLASGEAHDEGCERANGGRNGA